MNGYKQIHTVLKDHLKENTSFYVICESPEMQFDTQGLQNQFPQQILQLPCSDEAAIGVAIGLAISGAQAGGQR